MKTYPYMQRAAHSIEVPHVRNGRPGYRWAPGWEVVYSATRISAVTTYRDAQYLLSQAREGKV